MNNTNTVTIQSPESLENWAPESRFTKFIALISYYCKWRHIYNKEMAPNQKLYKALS